MFDDRIDLTFYVDAQNYLPIRAFEYWMEYITIGNSQTLAGAAAESTSKFAETNYFYRMNYPDFYALDQGFRVVKFERDFDGSFKGNGGVVNGTQNGLTYNFVRSFPIAVASMPVSYDASSLLKCTVSMTYIRYYIKMVLEMSQITLKQVLMILQYQQPNNSFSLNKHKY